MLWRSVPTQRHYTPSQSAGPEPVLPTTGRYMQRMSTCCFGPLLGVFMPAMLQACFAWLMLHLELEFSC
jgi:hypothetical protein